MSDRAVRYGNGTVLSAADLSAVDPGTWCKIDANGLAAASAAAGDGHGILADGGTASGTPVEVVAAGLYPDAKIGGTIKAGQRITNNSSGLTVQATGAAQGKGIALVNGSSGDRAPIWLGAGAAGGGASGETLTATTGAEAANAIPFVIACSVPLAVLRATVAPLATGIPGTNFTLTETGAGTPLQPAAGGGSTLIFSVDAAGAATLSVTDGSAVSTLAVLVTVEPISRGDIPEAYATATFA